jgi:hypothetical protein
MIVAKCIHGFYSIMHDRCYTYMHALHYSYGRMQCINSSHRLLPCLAFTTTNTKPTTNTTTKKQKKQHSKPSDDNDSSKDIGAELITRKFWARAIDDDALQTGLATVTAVGVFEADNGDWDTAE